MLLIEVTLAWDCARSVNVKLLTLYSTYAAYSSSNQYYNPVHSPSTRVNFTMGLQGSTLAAVSTGRTVASAEMCIN